MVLLVFILHIEQYWTGYSRMFLMALSSAGNRIFCTEIQNLQK